MLIAIKDFYEFQVSLMQLYPEEATNTKGKDRVLPLMPAPVEQVDENIAGNLPLSVEL